MHIKNISSPVKSCISMGCFRVSHVCALFNSLSKSHRSFAEVCVRVCTCAQVCVHVYVCVCACVRVRACTRVRVYVCARARMRVCSRTCACVFLQEYVLPTIHVHKNRYAQICRTHIFTRAHTPPPPPLHA